MSDSQSFSRVGNTETLSDEQKRLWQQVEVISKEIDFKLGDSTVMRSFWGADKNTGERIDMARHSGNLACDAYGRKLVYEEVVMQKENWGSPCAARPEDGSLRFNANVGIRTRGDDALNITLVETKDHAPMGSEGARGRHLQGETRRWEYQISRKGVDASKPENLLKVPVFNTCDVGLLADIGNKGSSYSSQHFTGKAFQPQKIRRNADNIEINVQKPESLGMVLAIVDRDKFEAFANRAPLLGGTLILPDYTTESVYASSLSTVAQIKNGENWGQVILPAEREQIPSDHFVRKQLKSTLYENDTFPQDELIWKEKMKESAARNSKGLNLKPYEGYGGVITDGEKVIISNDSEYRDGCGYNVVIKPECAKPFWAVPDIYTNNVAPPPVWLQGPGNKGTIDLIEFEGMVVIAGGGEIKVSAPSHMYNKFSQIYLTGGTKENKSIYTIDMPQSSILSDPLQLKVEAGNRELRVFRNDKNALVTKQAPILPSPICNLYNDCMDLNERGHIENDRIYIKGDHIEVRVRKGDKVETIYDSDKPELNQSSAIFKKDAGAVAAIAASGIIASDMPVNRRTAVQAMAAALMSAKASPYTPSVSDENIVIAPPSGSDIATQSLTAIFPDLKIAPSGKAIASLSRNSGEGRSARG